MERVTRIIHPLLLLQMRWFAGVCVLLTFSLQLYLCIFIIFPQRTYLCCVKTIFRFMRSSSLAHTNIHTINKFCECSKVFRSVLLLCSCTRGRAFVTTVDVCDIFIKIAFNVFVHAVEFGCACVCVRENVCIEQDERIRNEIERWIFMKQYQVHKRHLFAFESIIQMESVVDKGSKAING